MDITTLGIDLAKSVFQLHGIDADWRRRFAKETTTWRCAELSWKVEPCLIGMEACATSHLLGA